MEPPPQQLPGATARAGKPAKRQQTSRWLTCTTCRNTKLKCDGLFPCSRCWDRMCICCRPEYREMGKGATELALAGPGEGEAVRAGTFGRPLTTPTYIRLVFLRSHPQALAHQFVQEFMAVQAREPLDRAKVVRVLRLWHGRSLACSKDITHGILPALCNFMGIAPHDMAGVESIGQDPAAASGAEARRAVRQSSLYRLVDDGTSAVFICLTSGPHLYQVGNDVFERTFLGAEDFLGETLQRRTLQLLLFSSLIRPQDRHIWFAAWVRALFVADRHEGASTWPQPPGPPGAPAGPFSAAAATAAAAAAPRSQLIRTVDAEGRIRLHILQAFSLTMRSPASGAGGASGGMGHHHHHHHHQQQQEEKEEHGMILRLEPAPPSKYLAVRGDPSSSSATPIGCASNQAAAAEAGAGALGGQQQQKEEEDDDEDAEAQGQQPDLDAASSSSRVRHSSLVTLPFPGISEEETRRLLEPLPPSSEGGYAGSASSITSSSEDGPRSRGDASQATAGSKAGTEQQQQQQQLEEEGEDGTGPPPLMPALFATTSSRQQSVLRSHLQARLSDEGDGLGRGWGSRRKEEEGGGGGGGGGPRFPPWVTGAMLPVAITSAATAVPAVAPPLTVGAHLLPREDTELLFHLLGDDQDEQQDGGGRKHQQRRQQQAGMDGEAGSEEDGRGGPNVAAADGEEADEAVCCEGEEGEEQRHGRGRLRSRGHGLRMRPNTY